MLELKINCEDTTEAHVYLNAFNYLNLITDMYNALRNAKKHGTPESIVMVASDFLDDLSNAVEHHTGAY